MDPWVVRKEIEIDAPPERVWPYVATQDGYRRWSCTVADSYDVVLEERVGGRYEEHGKMKGEDWVNVGKVLAYEKPRKLTFTLETRRRNGSFSPIQTVTITLSDLGGRTRLILEHRGLDQLPTEQREVKFKSFNEGWGHALEELLGILAQELLPQLGHLLVYQALEIDAPAERIWRFIGTADGRLQMLRCRYPESQYEVDTLDPREGGRWESAGISAQTGDRFRQFGRVLWYEPPRLLVMTLQEDGWPAETTVTYRLTEYSDKTRVTLIHSGFEHLPPKRRLLTRKAYEIGRYRSLEVLRALVEGREVPLQYPLMIRREVEINAPIDRVWWYIGTQDGSLARHRAENVPGRMEYRAEILEEQPGGRYELRGIHGGQLFRIVGQVLAYDPPHVLALSWREDGWPVDTLVRFRLTEEGGRTKVTVIHHGFEHLPPELQQKAVEEYDAGRKRGLEVLRTLAERARAQSAPQL